MCFHNPCWLLTFRNGYLLPLCRRRNALLSISVQCFRTGFAGADVVVPAASCRHGIFLCAASVEQSSKAIRYRDRSRIDSTLYLYNSQDTLLVTLQSLWLGFHILRLLLVVEPCHYTSHEVITSQIYNILNNFYFDNSAPELCELFAKLCEVDNRVL